MWIYVCMCVCMYVCICIVCMYMCLCVYVCMCLRYAPVFGNDHAATTLNQHTIAPCEYMCICVYVSCVVFVCMYISTCLGFTRIPPPLLTHAPSHHVNTCVCVCICDVYLSVCTYPPVWAESEYHHRSWPTHHRTMWIHMYICVYVMCIWMYVRIHLFWRN